MPGTNIMEAVQSELEDVKATIGETVRSLARVEGEIAEAMRAQVEAKQGNDIEELRAMREKENKLREKENKLREKENKLRDKELYLMQRRDSEATTKPSSACSTGPRCLRSWMRAVECPMLIR